MWVMYARLRLPHLCVNTNNHLESSFGHLKDTVKPTMGMAETIEALTADDRIRANEYLHSRTKIGRHFHANYGDDINQLSKWTNPFVTKSIESQYTQAIGSVEEFHYKEDSKRRVVRGKTKAYHVDLRSWACTCSFSCSIKLPCQHAIAYLKHKNYDESIPLKAVNQRWIGPIRTRADVPGERLQFSPFVVIHKKWKLTKEQKYREAVSATVAVCSELADISDDDEFTEHLQVVLDQWRNVRQRKRVPATSVGHVNKSEEDLEELVGHGLSQVSQISQPHSLYSEEIGKVALVDPTLSPATGVLVAGEATSQLDSTQVSCGGEGSSDFQAALPATPTVRLNPRAAKSGRPRFNRGQVASTERDNRIIFNAAQRAWNSSGKVTLKGLLDSLESEKPSIPETVKRLEGLVIKTDFLRRSARSTKYFEILFSMSPPSIIAEEIEPNYPKKRLAGLKDDCIYFLVANLRSV